MPEDNKLNALRHAKGEIISLRKRLVVADAKLEVLDIFAATLFGSPGVKSEGAMHPDPIHLIDEALLDAED